MYIKTPAIILNTFNYSETSTIASIFTLEEGKIHCIAKGARRKGSVFYGKLDAINEIEAVYARGRSELFTLKECSLLNIRPHIREDLERLNAAMSVVVLIEETQPLHDPHSDVYRLSIKCFDAIEAGMNISSAVAFFKARLIFISGYSPDLEQCVRCSTKLKGTVIYNYAGHGFLCRGCSENERGMKVTAGAMEIYKRLCEPAMEPALKLRISTIQQEELDKLFRSILEGFLETHSEAGRIIKSLNRDITEKKREKKPK